MVLQGDRERVQALLKDTITLLCKNGLTFRSEFSIEALIGITLDKDDVFLVSINECIKSEASCIMENVPEPEVNVEITQDASVVTAGVPQQRRKRTRRRANNCHSGREEESDGGLEDGAWSHSDVGSLSVSAMEDSNSRLSQDLDLEPTIKQRTIHDIRDLHANKSEGVVIKEESVEVWEEQEELSSSDGFAVTDVKPKVQAVPNNQSVNPGLDVWTSAQQLLALQEQYRAAQPTRTAITTANPVANPTHSTNSLEHSQGSVEGGEDLLASLYKDMVAPPDRSTGRSQTINTETTDIQVTYGCEICGKTYMKRDGLVRHWKVHDDTLHRCKSCTLFFQSDDQLQQHIESRHGSHSLKHECNLCGKRFDRPFKLVRHLQTHDETNLEYETVDDPDDIQISN